MDSLGVERSNGGARSRYRKVMPRKAGTHMFVAASPVRLPKACVAVVGDTPRGDFEGGAAQVSRRSSSVPLRDANSSIVADFSIGALSDLLD